MAADEPPYLTVGTDVSAKYKGAFCEAKIKKVNRVVKCKVTFKNNQGSVMVPDDQIRGSLRIGALVEARHPEKNQFMEAIINKMQDYSQYTVVFDDGDETTLRRTSLCLKSGRHFAESPTLDQFPLTNPEHFGTPVIGAVKSKRKRRSTYNSSTVDYSSSDEEMIPKKTKPPRRREKDPDIGKVVCVDYGDRRKKDSWYPGLVVPANSSQDSFKINVKEEYLIRSFKDGKYYQVPKKDTREFGRDVYRKVESNTLRTAVDKALLYCEKGELPAHWDKAMETASGDDEDSHDTDTDTSDDEPSEEKDRFVAQLYKFMDERGTPINKAPSVGNRDVNLYKLFKVVHKMGGYNRVTNQNKWKIVYTKMGMQSSNQSGSNQLKLAYKRFLHSFEDFYRKLGCTMVSNSRSTRGRHRSDRNFIITRNAASAKARSRTKDKSVEKKPDDKSSGSEKKEKCKLESPKSDEATRKRIDKAKADEPKVKVKKEEEKPRLVRSQSLNKEKRDNSDEKKETRTDRARAREESKREKTESPEKKKETRSSVKSEQDKREKETVEKKVVEVKESKDRSPKEKKIEKPAKESKASERKEDSPKEKKPDRRGQEKAKDIKAKVKNEEKKMEKEKEKEKEEDTKEKKIDKSAVDVTRTEVRIFTRDKKEKLSLDKNDVLQLKGVRDEKSWGPLKITTDEGDEELAAKDKPGPRKMFSLDSEPSVILSEIKTEKDEGTDTESSPFPVKTFHEGDDEGEEDAGKEGMKKQHSGDDEAKSIPDLTDSDEEVFSCSDDGSGSEKQVEVGDKVKVKYGRGRTRKVYEAKVLKIDTSTSENRFFVHYTGWNVRYDEWVKRSYIVENMSEKNKFTRQKKQDSDNKNGSSVTKKIDRSKPPGFNSAPKLTRKNSTSSTTSVSSSRTTRSDKNNSLHTSPFSKGLQPKKRIRRKSGVSVALTDTSQESESEEDDLLFLYPDGELNDDEEAEVEPAKKTADAKKELESDQDTEKEMPDACEEKSNKPIPSLDPKPVVKEESLSNEAPVSSGEGKPVALKDTGLKKFDYNFSERKVPCVFAKKMNVVETNIAKLAERESKPAKVAEKNVPLLTPEKEKHTPEENVAEFDIAEKESTSLGAVGDNKQAEDVKPVGDKLESDHFVADKISSDKLLDKLSSTESKVSLVKDSVQVLKKMTDDQVSGKEIKTEKSVEEIVQLEVKEDVIFKNENPLDEKMPPLITYMGSGEDQQSNANKSAPDGSKTKLVEDFNTNLLSKTPTLGVKKEVNLIDGESKTCPSDKSESSQEFAESEMLGKITESTELNKDTGSPSISNTTEPILSVETSAKLIKCNASMDEKSVSEHKSDISYEENASKIVETADEGAIEKKVDMEATAGVQTTLVDMEDNIKHPNNDSNGSSNADKFNSVSPCVEHEGSSKDFTPEETPKTEKQEDPKTILQPPAIHAEMPAEHEIVHPPKILEVETSSSTLSTSHHVDLISSSNPEKSLINKNSDKESISESTKETTESKHAQDHGKDFSHKLDVEKTTSVFESKDTGLQTSVITFARSSASLCTYASSSTEPEDSSLQAETKDSDPSPLNSFKKLKAESNNFCEGKTSFVEPRLHFSEDTSSKEVEDDSTSTCELPKVDEKQESPASPVKTEGFLDDCIHESLTELSIDDESQDNCEKDVTEKPHTASSIVSNVFLNVTSDINSKDSKDLFFPKNTSDDNFSAACKSDSSEGTSQSLKQLSSPKDLNEEEKTVLSSKEEDHSLSNVLVPKKEGKKKKSKISKDKKGVNSDHERDEPKLKEGKGKSKKKRLLDADESGKLKDSELKVKNKKLKKNKNKKRFSKYDDADAADEAKEILSEKMKRKEKRKRDEKKYSKFDLKSESSSGFRMEASKKERKKGRKNKLGSDKKADVGDKKVKKKKKVHPDDNIDTDSEKESVIRSSEKKKEKKKKAKPKDTSSSDDAADGKLLIDESNILEESQEKNEDPDMSFLLCEEKVPASPVNTLPDDTTASSSIDDSNNVSPSSDDEQVQSGNIDLFPRSSNLEMLNPVGKHNDACAVLDNTPPTTPSSTGSISSGSPPRDREPFVHYTESTQSGRDSGDGESDSFHCDSNRAEVSESEEYRAARTLAFAVCKSVPEKPRECSRSQLKRQKSENDDFSPSKRKRKSRRSFAVAETPSKHGHARVKGLSRYSKGESCDAFESSGASAAITSPPHGHSSSLFASFSHSSNQHTSVTLDTSSSAMGKSNFYIPLHEYKDPEKRIAVLQDKMSELKKMYASLKAEVAAIDRRRKKARKKMREAAGSTANTSSTHSEDAQNYS